MPLGVAGVLALVLGLTASTAVPPLAPSGGRPHTSDAAAASPDPGPVDDGSVGLPGTLAPTSPGIVAVPSSPTTTSAPQTGTGTTQAPNGTPPGGRTTGGTTAPGSARSGGVVTPMTAAQVPEGPVLWAQPGRTRLECDGAQRSDAGAVSTFTLQSAPRCEAVPSMRSLQEGDDIWFTFETRLAPGFPIGADWQVIAQLKNDGTGSPPVSLAVEQWGGSYVLTGGYGYPGGARPYQLRLGSASVGSWVSWAMHVRFSADPSLGSVTVVRDGTVVLDDFHPPGGTLYPARSASGANPNSASGAIDYLKFGYYRSSGMNAGGAVDHRGWKVIG